MASTQFAQITSEVERKAPGGSKGSGKRAGRSKSSKVAIFLDICTVAIACIVSQAIFNFTHGFPVLPVPEFNVAAFGTTPGNLAALLIAYTTALIVVSRRLNLYRRNRLGGYVNDFRLTMQASLTAGLFVTGMLYLVHAPDVPRSLVLNALTLVTILLCTRRIAHRSLDENRNAAAVANRHVLIVGSLPEATMVQQDIEKLRYGGYTVTGVVPLPHNAQNVNEHALNRILKEARANFVDEILLVSPHQRAVADEMLLWARELEVDLTVVVPSLYEGLTWYRDSEFLGHFLTLPLHRGTIPEFSLFLKRCMDVLVSATALAICAIPMLVIAAFIKLDSEGPVFYRSERVGRKGRTFKCTKFRTMIPNADKKLAELMHLNERDGVLFKLTNDPRVTRVGRILRKYSLDELPQFFDVLRGDMSIVGPRPPVAPEVQKYELTHLRRLEVTPGITGLWQVQARQDPSFDSYVSLDIDYIRNWSIWLDLKIMARTIGVVLAGTGS